MFHHLLSNPQSIFMLFSLCWKHFVQYHYRLQDLQLCIFAPTKDIGGKVYFRSQILECPSIGEYWNIFGSPVLLENVIFTILECAGVIQKLTILECKKWSSIVQYLCTSIWDLKYTFSDIGVNAAWYGAQSPIACDDRCVMI